MEKGDSGSVVASILTVLEGIVWKKVGWQLIKNGGSLISKASKKTGLTGFNRFH